MKDFSKKSGNTYENKINDLHISIKENQKNNEATRDDINNLIEIMKEYEEWKKWAKKEVKRRSALLWNKSKKKNTNNDD